MRNSYEWIALSSGGCRSDRVSTPLISVLTGGHSSMSALRPGSFVRRSWFCWTAHPDRLGQLAARFRWRRLSDADKGAHIIDKYDGAIWCRHLKTNSLLILIVSSRIKAIVGLCGLCGGQNLYTFNMLTAWGCFWIYLMKLPIQLIV